MLLTFWDSLQPYMRDRRVSRGVVCVDVAGTRVVDVVLRGWSAIMTYYVSTFS